MDFAAKNRCVLFSWLVLATVGIAIGRMHMAAPTNSRALTAEASMAEARTWHPPTPPIKNPISSPDADTIRQRQITEFNQGDLPDDQEGVADVEPAVATRGTDVASTSMRCLGTTTTTRACHFQDLYYDVGSGHFIYYGPAGSTPKLFGVVPAPNDPWLRLIRYVRIPANHS